MTRERLQEHIFTRKLISFIQPSNRVYNRPHDSLMGKGRSFSLTYDYEANPHSLEDLFPEPRISFCKLLKREIKAYIQKELKVQICDIKEITLHYGLRLTIRCGESIIYHANPCISGKKWYDDVIILDQTNEQVDPEISIEEMMNEDEKQERRAKSMNEINDENEPNKNIYGAGRLVSFVFISIPSHPNVEKREHIMALVHRFQNVAALRRNQKKEDIYDAENESLSPCFGSHIPYSYMKLGYKGRNPDISLIDSECISSGVWTHEDFDHPGNFWFLRSWFQSKKQAALLMR